MCGIMGYTGGDEAVPVLFAGLRRLEYRGYDAAGLAVTDGGRVRVLRAAGKLRNLEQLAFRTPLLGTVGIGHTRWATLAPPPRPTPTRRIIFSAPHPLTRQLPITWFTGVFVAFILTSPLLLRPTVAGEWSSLGGLIVGIFFVPSQAMAFGCWTNDSKLFEGGYLFLWYIASMYSIPALDFMGRIPVARENEIPLFYLLATLLWIAVAYWGRRRQAMK